MLVVVLNVEVECLLGCAVDFKEFNEIGAVQDVVEALKLMGGDGAVLPALQRCEGLGGKALECSSHSPTSGFGGAEVARKEAERKATAVL